MKPFAAFNRSGTMGFCVLAALIALLLLAGRPQTFTGDEQRYFLYSISILSNGSFVIPLAEWQRLVFGIAHTTPSELPAGATGVLMNSVYLSTLLSPIAKLFSLPGLRAATLLAGLLGLFNLFKLCKRFASPRAALIATGMAGFTIPLLPYLHLFYMEAFIFALVCIGWERLQSATRNASGDLVTALVLLSIPYVHLRGSVVAAALFLFLLWQLRERGLFVRATVFALLAMAALAGLLALNLSIYGAITGPVNTARPPYPSEWFSVLSMQSFNVRHGLFAYAPVWALGYAGLGLGAWRGSAIARQGMMLAIIAAVTGIGINPGECWPARFWVLSIPMLAVGFCTWWELGRQKLLRLATVVLIVFTLLNTLIFILRPDDYLENRQTTTTYQYAFSKLGHFNFGLMLPVEVDDEANLAAARYMALGAGLFVLLTGFAAAKRKPVYAIPALLILAAAVDLGRVSIVPSSDYAVVRQNNRVVVMLNKPTPAIYVQLGHNWQTWFEPPTWRRFSVIVAGVGGQRIQETRSANQVMSAACVGKIASVTVEAPEGFDMEAEAAHRLVVYRSNSALRQWFGDPRYIC